MLRIKIGYVVIGKNDILNPAQADQGEYITIDLIYRHKHSYKGNIVEQVIRYRSMEVNFPPNLNYVRDTDHPTDHQTDQLTNGQEDWGFIREGTLPIMIIQ